MICIVSVADAFEGCVNTAICTLVPTFFNRNGHRGGFRQKEIMYRITVQMFILLIIEGKCTLHFRYLIKR